MEGKDEMTKASSSLQDLRRGIFVKAKAEPPRRFSLCLDVYPPPQVLQTAGRLCHLVLAFHVVGGVTTQQGPIAPSALPDFITTADPSATLSPSAHFPGSPVIGPTLLRRFRAGARRASSC